MTISHNKIWNGSGYRCLNCDRSWDQGEQEPAFCRENVDVATLTQTSLEIAPIAALARQEGGSHYKGLRIQPVEFIMRNGWDFCLGSALKYISRWRLKNGAEDLKKAFHFLELRDDGANLNRYGLPSPIISMREYVMLNGFTDIDDTRALFMLERIAYYNVEGQNLRDHLKTMIAQAI